MPDILSTSPNNDQMGPPPYPDPFQFPQLPSGYGEIRCKEHRWRQGTNWGLGIGDFNRGEVAGDNVMLQAHTSESGDVEDLQANAQRTVLLGLVPGSEFKSDNSLRITVFHTMSGTVQCLAMCNVEKDPPVVAATSRITITQLRQNKIELTAIVRADRQTVQHERKVEGTKGANGEFSVKGGAGGIPDVSVTGGATATLAESETSTTVRLSVQPPDSQQVVATAFDTDTLSLAKRTSKAFDVTATAFVSAAVGAVDGFADASLNFNGQWIIEAQVLDSNGEPLPLG